MSATYEHALVIKQGRGKGTPPYKPNSGCLKIHLLIHYGVVNNEHPLLKHIVKQTLIAFYEAISS